MREGRWVIADPYGKGGLVRTVSALALIVDMPSHVSHLRGSHG